MNKEAGKPRPWTDDPILDKYKFCNVFRELDRVTIWIKDNIRDPYILDNKLPALMGIARQINWPPTLQAMIDAGILAPYNAQATRRLMKKIPGKVLTGAYLITGSGVPQGWKKCEHIAVNILGPLWKGKITITETVEEMWKQLMTYHGFGPFLSYQVCVDLSWTPWLCNAPDLNTFAAMGPGSKRGVRWLLGKKPSSKEGLEVMRRLYEEQDLYREEHVPHIRLSDIQNALCETDKYLRTVKSNGVKRPRAIYKETSDVQF